LKAVPRKNPAEPYKNVPRGYSKQVGTSLSYWTAFNIYGFYGHPDYLRLVEYERAFTTDETVGTGLEFIKLSILAALGEYQHPDHKIQDFVNENLARMSGSYKEALGELIVSSLWSGFGVSEVVYKPEDGRIWIDFIANYNPRTINLQVNKQGRLTWGEDSAFNSSFTTGIWQDRLGGTPIVLPEDRTILVTHNRRYNSYYGESAIKRIYKNWRLKESVLEMWNVALDRYGTPVTYAIVPHGYTGNEVPDPSTPGQMKPETIGDSTAKAISEIQTGTGLVVVRPSPTDDIKLGTLTTGNNFGDSFSEAIKYYNSAIYRGLLIPQLLIQDSAGGSLGGQAVAAVHFDVYKMMLQALYAEIVEPFVEQVIGQLIRLNFGKQDNPGKFLMQPSDSASTEVMSNVFTNLCNTGVVNISDAEDLNMVRAMCGLPMLDEKRAAKLAKQNEVKPPAPPAPPTSAQPVKPSNPPVPKPGNPQQPPNRR